MARLTNAQIEEQLRAVAKVIRQHPEGISRESLTLEYTNKTRARLASRTLQRRLEQLVLRGEIAKEGDGPGTIYRASEATTESAPADAYPPLSAEATKLRALIRRPISARAPVGYDADWLYAYKPGKTWYLPPKLRIRLRELGRTPDENRPAGTFARDVLDRLLIDLAWASSRLEGSTYSRLDTQNLLEFGQRAEGKDAREAQMILNHKAAIELLVSDAEYVGFNRSTLLALHTALSENLLGNAGDEGRLREIAVSITGTTYTPIAIPQVIREGFERIVETAVKIPDPFEQSFFAMVHIPYLQPFVDVNKRTSRLAANIPLIAANLCPLSFVDVPENAYIEGTHAIYEQKRVELLRDVFSFAYERSCAQYRVVRDSLGEPDPIRLRYRTELADVVSQTVKAGEAPTTQLLKQRGEQIGVSGDDSPAFAEAALRVLLGLHEGSAGRYRLTPGEFKKWKALFSGLPTGGL